MRSRVYVLLLLAIVSGCSHDTRSYSVSLRNETRRPVTIALTKTGGPVENAWASPELIADGQANESAANGFAVVGPGRIGSVNNVKGEFPGNVQAMLRVYAGEPTLGQMLRMFPGQERADFTLKPGKNDLVVRSVPGGFAIQPR
jgi:hypothetical protein